MKLTVVEFNQYETISGFIKQRYSIILAYCIRGLYYGMCHNKSSFIALDRRPVNVLSDQFIFNYMNSAVHYWNHVIAYRELREGRYSGFTNPAVLSGKVIVSGVYLIFNLELSHEPVYIGKTKDITTRFTEGIHGKDYAFNGQNGVYVLYIPINECYITEVETLFIQQLRPVMNYTVRNSLLSKLIKES